jgi:hypothetical protein
MIDEGPDEFKGRGFEILLVEVEVWCEVPEFAAQSWTEVGGGWSTMVLKEFTSDNWS